VPPTAISKIFTTLGIFGLVSQIEENEWNLRRFFAHFHVGRMSFSTFRMCTTFLNRWSAKKVLSKSKSRIGMVGHFFIVRFSRKKREEKKRKTGRQTEISAPCVFEIT
jgi:hypothetical protein